MREALVVRRHHLGGRSGSDHLSVVKQHGSLAETLDRSWIVRHEDHRAPLAAILRDASHALLDERLVADGKHLVEQQHIRSDVHRHREAEAREHA